LDCELRSLPASAHLLHPSPAFVACSSMQASHPQRRRRQKPRKPQPSGAAGRAQTPVPSRHDPVDGPSTPAGTSAGVSSPEVDMHCPQPHRAFPGGAPVAQLEHSHLPGAAWAPHDEAAHELRELLGSNKGKRSLILEGQQRPLSSVSTSAGPTPVPDERASPVAAMHAPSTSGRSGMSSQVRKVFVGGVPQDMTQDDLYTIFSEYGFVKKAWLQRYRASGAANSNPPHNHRGFGFLIFYDGSSVEQLLGDNFSRFIVLKDGRKLEVKRAVNSNDMLVNSSETARAPTRNVQQQQSTTGSTWERPHVQAQQTPWQHDPRLGWLPQAVSPQQTMMMASTTLASTPWTHGIDGQPLVMSQMHPPAYSPVQALQLAGSANPRPPAMLLPSNSAMQMPANAGLPSNSALQMSPNGGFGKGQQQQGLTLTSGPVAGMMATMPNNTMQAVIAPVPGPTGRIMPEQWAQQTLAASGAGVPWPMGTALYSVGVVPEGGFMQPPGQVVFNSHQPSAQVPQAGEY